MIKTYLYKPSLYSITILCLYTGILSSQHLLQTNGQAIVNQNNDTILLQGMGLGGWMLQEGYMLQTAEFANAQHKIRESIEDLIGEENTDLFYEAWLENHVTRADIDSLASWGFNSVRLPMHYNLYTLPIEDEPIEGEHTWLDRGFELTDSLIAWCKANEMYVILDLHAAPGGQGQDEGISDYDRSKPSLWESELNQDKTVALWKKLAETYRDEEWVAGYDLLNEPNWNLPGGRALRNIYEEITEAIRTVDRDHIIFIEGNWFANDFTGLTPPWDDNMVYSPHKYWSTNDKASLQSFLDLRESFNVPLYLGESGENSNVWFTEAISLLEDLEIGWAWWPMKKIESIAGPLSVPMTPEYQTLLNYWNSGMGTKPSQVFATESLMNIAEGLKIENCVYLKDVIDAMFRQIDSESSLPYNMPHSIPGIIYASDFDLGRNGSAYYDNEIANFQVSTGTFTPWNTGWTYRNDGVDLQVCEDNINTNGINVAWIGTGEWTKYSISVEDSGLYNIHMRVASETGDGILHFETNKAHITAPKNIPNTGGWQTWTSVIIPNVFISNTDTELILVADNEGFNISSFELNPSSLDASSLITKFLSANTKGENSIELFTNKFLAATDNSNGFQIHANGISIPISSISIDEEDSRIVRFDFEYRILQSDLIQISYTANHVLSTDGIPLESFLLEPVKNNAQFVHVIPTIIESEEYGNQLGAQLENTGDVGGGQNVGFLDPCDYLDYEIFVPSAGEYEIDFRTASLTTDGRIEFQIIDSDRNLSVIKNIPFESTGGWQNWTTSTEVIELPQGRYTMRLFILEAPFNINWVDFRSLNSMTGDEDEDEEDSLVIYNQLINYPNPSEGSFAIEYNALSQQDINIYIYDFSGALVYQQEFENTNKVNKLINLNAPAAGVYHLVLELEDGEIFTNRVVITTK